MAPRPKHEIARDHFTLALEDIAAENEREGVSALFYAAEAALVSLADSHGIDTKRNHGKKASAAKALHADGALAEDFGPLLRLLNQQRKAVWYDGELPDFGKQAVDDVAGAVERLVEAAEAAAR